MELRIHAPRVELEPQLRERIELRVRLALGRHSARLASARVALHAEPSGRGDRSAQCRIRLRLRRGETLEIEEGGPDLLAAAAQAAWRAEHRLDRERTLSARGPAWPEGGARREVRRSPDGTS